MSSKSAKKRNRLQEEQKGLKIIKESSLLRKEHQPKTNAWEGDIIKESFTTLLYDRQFFRAIEERYPNASYEDASDYIHTHRIEVKVPNISGREFWKFAMREGFAMDCLEFQLLFMIDKKFLEFVKEEIDILRKENKPKNPQCLTH